MKKRLLTLLLSVSMMFVMGGCSSSKGDDSKDKAKEVVTKVSEPLTIDFWHNMSGNQTPVLEGIVKNFNETVGKEKNITVNPVFQGSSKDLNSKVVGAIKSKQAPAVVLSMTNFVQDYMESECVVD